MSLPNFKARTSMLEIPKRIYDMYDDVVKSCESCGKFEQAPERSRVSGYRANVSGDIWFLDHVDVTIGAYRYVVLVVIDAATNFICCEPQRDSATDLTKEAFRKIMDDMCCKPKAICADEYFTGDKLYPWFETLGIRIIRLGPMTPWPNRAEAAVKLQ